MAVFKNTDLLLFRQDSDGNFIITLKQARLAFEHVWTPWAKKESENKKYSGKFLIAESTHAKEIEILKKFMESLRAEYFKTVRLKPDHFFFKDGNNEGREEFEGTWFVSASEKADSQPALIDRDKSKLKKSDDKIYSGAVVNVMFKPWKQDNDWGKKINANLLAVQFHKHGPKFSNAGGVKQSDLDEGFDEEPIEEEEMDEGSDGFGDD